MIAERAEHGTKVISTEAITRSRPVVVLADGRDRRHVAAEPEQEGHGDAAVQADPVEAAVDGEGDALHDAGLLQRHQQQHQRNHVRHDDADESDQAIRHRAADDAEAESGCQSAAQSTSRAEVSQSSQALTSNTTNSTAANTATLPIKPQCGCRNSSSSQ